MESDTKGKIFKRPTLLKVTLFECNLLLVAHTAEVYYGAKLLKRKFQQFSLGPSASLETVADDIY